MTIYDWPPYKTCRSIYYVIVNLLYSRKGVPITINNYSFRFVPKHYRFYTSDYEQYNVKLVVQHVKKGSTCIDIGAHFGFYSMLLAKYFQCKVYSFEPTPYTQKVLARNIVLNHLEANVEIVPKAVSFKDDVCTFYIQEFNGAVSNSLIDYHHSDEHKTPYKVQVTSVDNFSVDKKIDFIKIDAEGEELQVLKGASKTIKKDKPKMLLALHPPAMKARGDSLKMIWDMLKMFEYFAYSESGEISQDAFCSNPNLFDVLLIPEKL
jgi:FkbM family methyltransferase